MPVLSTLAAVLILITAKPAGPDALVVCPSQFRAALAPWEAHRRQQGHEILIVDVPTDSSKLRSTIRRLAKSGALKYLVLIGDVPSYGGDVSAAHDRHTTPTNYVTAVVNRRFGSEA